MGPIEGAFDTYGGFWGDAAGHLGVEYLLPLAADEGSEAKARRRLQPLDVYWAEGCVVCHIDLHLSFH